MASKTLLALTAKLTADTSKFKQGLDKGKKEVNTFSKSIKKVGALIAGAFAVSTLKNFARESVRLYDVQAKAETGLLTALKGRKDIQQDIIRQAGEMQRKTLMGDEQSIEAAGRLAQVLGTNKQAIQELLPLVADFATAKKMDMAMAAELIAKSVGSSTNALSRYGVVIEGAVGSSERLKSTTDALNQMVGGQAEAAAEAGTASSQQLANSWGDVKEEFGELTNMLNDEMTPALNNLAIAAGNAMGAVNDVLSDEGLKWYEKLAAFFDSGAGSAAREFAESNKKLKEEDLKLVGQLSDRLIKTFDDEAKAWNKSIDIVIEQLGKLKNEDKRYNELIDNRIKTLEKLRQEEGKQTEEVEKQIPILQELADKIKETTDKRDNAITPEQLAKHQTYLEQLKEEKKFYESLREGDLDRTPPPDKLEAEQITSITVENEGLDERLDKLQQLKRLQEEYGEAVAESSEESIMWSEAVDNAMTNAINSVSYALANMMTNLAIAFTGAEVSFKDMISGMLSALRDILVGLLAQAIAGMLAQEVSKEGVYGLAVAAAGIAGILALWDSYVPDFAEGGIVSGETLARVGEYPGAVSNPEVIAPLSKLKGMLAESSGGGVVEFVIEGKVLKGMLKKQSTIDSAY